MPSIKLEKEKADITKKEILKNILSQLLNNLLNLEQVAAQKRDYEFEKFLTNLFNIFEMKARSPFRLTGGKYMAVSNLREMFI